MNLKEAVAKYGVQPTLELLDHFLINAYPSTEFVRQWAVRNKVCSRSTRFVTPHKWRQRTTWWNGIHHPDAKEILILTLTNGRNQTRLRIETPIEEIGAVLREAMVGAGC